MTLTKVTIDAVDYYLTHETPWEAMVAGFVGENVPGVTARGILAYAESRGATLYTSLAEVSYP